MAAFPKIKKTSVKPVPEVASRQLAGAFTGGLETLPDPDIVLSNSGLGLDGLKWMLNDAHLWSCFQSVNSKILAREWRIDTPSEATSKRVQKKMLTDVTDMIDGIDLYALLSDIMRAPLWGMQPIEVIWASVNSKWVPTKLEARPPEWFTFSELNELKFLSKAQPENGELVPDFKILLPRYYPSYENPFGERILSKCYWLCTIKRAVLKHYAKFCERYGMPWPHGKVPVGTSLEDIDALLASLVRMLSDGVVVTTDDKSIEFLESASKGASSDVYKGIIDFCNAEISKIFTGSTLTSELTGSTGSYAASQTHQEVRNDFIDALERLDINTVNQLIRWFVLLNYGENTPAPVFMFWEEESVERERAERDKVLYEIGVRFSETYITSAYGFEEKDIEIKENAATLPEPGPEAEKPGTEAEKPEPGRGKPEQESVDEKEEPEEKPEADGKKSGFAEAADDTGVENYLGMERTVTASLNDAESHMRKSLEPILSATTFDEISDIINTRSLNLEDFKEHLARVMYVSGISGIASNRGEV